MAQTDIICCPKCKHDLQFSENGQLPGSSSGKWKCSTCNREFDAREGFVFFINEEDVFKFSKRTEFFRSIYAALYTPLTNLMFIPCGGVFKARKEVLENLELRPGQTILETGIGTGDNVKFLGCRHESCLFYGLDNQFRMIKACARNARRWKQTVHLYRANAEELPFRDNAFDVVFHLGAINLFQDKKKAIDEMIRVAKPGSRIVIADESEKASKLFAIFVGKQDPVVPPVDLVPGNMLEISLKSIWNEYGYLITFRKPA